MAKSRLTQPFTSVLSPLVGATTGDAGTVSFQLSGLGTLYLREWGLEAMRRSHSDFQAKRIMQLEPLENRHLMAGDLSVAQPIAASQQPAEASIEALSTVDAQTDVAAASQYNSSDVNRDAKTTALDALMVINFLNSQPDAGGHQTTEGISGEDLNDVVDNPYDVNRDGRVSAADALWVINVMNKAESADPVGGCSCGGLGCPACSAPTNQLSSESLEASSSEQTEGLAGLGTGSALLSGGCSCGGVGCPACSPSTNQPSSESLDASPNEQTEGLEGLGSSSALLSGGCSCGGLGCAACSGDIS